MVRVRCNLLCGVSFVVYTHSSFGVVFSDINRPLGWLPFLHNWAFMNDAAASFVNAVVAAKEASVDDADDNM